MLLLHCCFETAAPADDVWENLDFIGRIIALYRGTLKLHIAAPNSIQNTCLMFIQSIKKNMVKQ